MRVCFISMSPVAGFKSFLENTALVMEEQGFEVTVLYLSRNDSISVRGTNEIIYDLSEHRNEKYRNVLLELRKNVRRILFRLKHDRTSDWVVLKNNLFTSQTKAVRNAKACAPKLDLSGYDCVISAEEIQCNYFLAYSVTAKRKIGYIHPDYSKTPYDRFYDRHALSKLDYVCATSKANAEAIKKVLPSIKEKVVGVPNPINVADIVRKSKEIDVQFDRNVFNIMTVSRLDNTYKALDRLLLIAKRLKDNGDLFVWRIIGDGEYAPVMRAYIARNSLEKNVIMMGKRTNPIPYVRASELFVLQSYSEGYPMSVCEALAVDTPVLVTNYPSASEQVVNGVTGYIVDNEIDAIYEQLHFVIHNPGEAEQIRSNLRSYDKSKLENIDELLKIVRL